MTRFGTSTVNSWGLEPKKTYLHSTWTVEAEKGQISTLVDRRGKNLDESRFQSWLFDDQLGESRFYMLTMLVVVRC